MIDLALHNISKEYGSVIAVDDVSLEVPRGEWLSLVGPSGCGKTTTLRMIAGFIEPTAGTIAIKGCDVTSVPPYRRSTGMVFQNYALFPHMTVEQNVAYGLRIRKVAPALIKKKVEEVLAIVKLEGYQQRYPTRELSGGQQQRVALARALAIEPDLLLLDEPLSNLDAKLREDLCVEMAQLQRRLNITTIYVTHDQQEALSMSTQIAVMDKGRLHQIGPPDEIYERPATRFVAGFIGKINLLKGVPIGADLLGAVDVKVQAGSESIVLRVPFDGRHSQGSEIDVAIRPELLELVCGENSESTIEGSQVLHGKVLHVAFYGDEIGYQVGLDGDIALSVSEKNRRQTPVQIGQPVVVRIAGEHCSILD